VVDCGPSVPLIREILSAVATRFVMLQQHPKVLAFLFATRHASTTIPMFLEGSGTTILYLLILLLHRLQFFPCVQPRPVVFVRCLPDFERFFQPIPRTTLANADLMENDVLPHCN
jgi:hypothetical protein